MVHFNFKTSKSKPLTICFLLVFLASCNYSDQHQKKEKIMSSNKEMATYVIEREAKGVGNSTPAELKAISRESNSAIEEMGPGIQWIHSYVVGEKTYCVYKAMDKSIINDHAEKVGAPAQSISKVSAIIGPDTEK